MIKTKVNQNVKNLIMKSNKQNEIFNIRKVKNQKKWTREEDELLLMLVLRNNEKHWKEISKKFFKKNSLQCFSRYKRIRPGIIKGSWKKEEDLQIIDLVNKHGKSWSKISRILGTRNGKQIRDRFINVLDPDIKKGKFTEEEDNNLKILYKEYGPKWALVAKYFPNRTADMVKNRFNSSIKRKISADENQNLICLKETISMKDKHNEDHKGNLNSNDSNHNITMQTSNDSECNSIKGSSSDNLFCLQSDSNYNKSFGSSINEDNEFYTQNISNFNCDFLSCKNKIKADYALYPEESFNWNYGDYFNMI